MNFKKYLEEIEGNNEERPSKDHCFRYEYYDMANLYNDCMRSDNNLFRKLLDIFIMVNSEVSSDEKVSEIREIIKEFKNHKDFEKFKFGEMLSMAGRDDLIEFVN